MWRRKKKRLNEKCVLMNKNTSFDASATPKWGYDDVYDKMSMLKNDDGDDGEPLTENKKNRHSEKNTYSIIWMNFVFGLTLGSLPLSLSFASLSLTRSLHARVYIYFVCCSRASLAPSLRSRLI